MSLETAVACSGLVTALAFLIKAITDFLRLIVELRRDRHLKPKRSRRISSR